MQDMNRRDMQRLLSDYGYKKVRQNGTSHAVYEREVTVKDTISIPESNKTINGCMAQRLCKQMEKFDLGVAQIYKDKPKF